MGTIITHFTNEERDLIKYIVFPGSVIKCIEPSWLCRTVWNSGLPEIKIYALAIKFYSLCSVLVSQEASVIVEKTVYFFAYNTLFWKNAYTDSVFLVV